MVSKLEVTTDLVGVGLWEGCESQTQGVHRRSLYCGNTTLDLLLTSIFISSNSFFVCGL